MDMLNQLWGYLISPNTGVAAFLGLTVGFIAGTIFSKHFWETAILLCRTVCKLVSDHRKRRKKEKAKEGLKLSPQGYYIQKDRDVVKKTHMEGFCKNCIENNFIRTVLEYAGDGILHCSTCGIKYRK